jgi:1-aminocyclopropane-1-carboxylate deaminase/D-cysteine desulfhydrase-like pyridoxal-dependent ACC family enzyme
VAVNGRGRVPLAALPTPLVRARRLERHLGHRALYVKRDDLTGFALAGNKARKLEFLLGDAVARGCDVLVTGGGPGSNHCQGAAVGAAAAGLQCSLVMYGQEPVKAHPNLALARSCGAMVRFTGDPDRRSVDPVLQATASALEDAGRSPYVVPRGGASPVGALGYALAVEELATQLGAEGIDPDVVVVATGSCGTQAGLMAGIAAGGHDWRVVGASVSRPIDECRKRVLELATECARLRGSPSPAPTRVEVIDARGPGYGVASRPAVRAARLAARTEGMILDPVFTAKAFAAFLELVDRGESGPAVFIHTGGTSSAVLEMTAAMASEEGNGNAPG